MGYLAAALPVVFQQKNFTWWFLYPKGMGLALLLINSKYFGILDPPNGGGVEGQPYLGHCPNFPRILAQPLHPPPQ